jgi:hypothetical protein
MPEGQQTDAPEKTPVYWEARQIVLDAEELCSMSPEQIARYSGQAQRRRPCS